MKYFKIILWLIFYLILIDTIVNMLFHYPKDPRDVHPSFLQSYFDYGRSVEGKLHWMTRPSIEMSAPRVAGGWLKSDKYLSLPNKATGDGEILVALYGMSHTQCLWEAIRTLDTRFVIRGFMAAGAPPNWSYAAYEFDRGRHKADVAILGILTDTVPQITSTTGMTAFFDSSFPYTFPRYFAKNGNLVAKDPPFYHAKGYIEHFYDKAKWNSYRSWLAQNDKYYDPILFGGSFLDNSALFRLLRRTYSEWKKDKLFKDVYTKEGFREGSEEVLELRAIVAAFAESARKDGIIPILYLVNSKGTGDRLFKIMKPVLDARNIPYLSTHVVCPPDDPRVYLVENSHFIPSKDTELATEMKRIIDAQMKKKTIKTSTALARPVL